MTQTDLEKWSTMTLILLSFLYKTISGQKFAELALITLLVVYNSSTYLILIINGFIIALQFSGEKNQCSGSRTSLIKSWKRQKAFEKMKMKPFWSHYFSAWGRHGQNERSSNNPVYDHNLPYILLDRVFCIEIEGRYQIKNCG